MLRAQKAILAVAGVFILGNVALAWLAFRAQATPKRKDEAFVRQFAQQFWPLLTRGGEDSCVGCHDAQNSSDLHFFPDARSSFLMLLEKDYFALNEPDSLVGRLTTTHPKKHMPKGKSSPPWSEAEIQRLRAYVTNLTAHFKITGKADEQFPAALWLPYQGPVPSALDNQFISYRQLRGKIQTIFADDWVRQGRDRFQENIALFGGADFRERFNESTKASATFLTGLDMLSRDVAARAYAMKTGPFAGRAERLPAPVKMRRPDAAYKRDITRLYQTLLFRAPTRAEIEQSFALLKSVYRAEPAIRAGDFELSFNLIVEDAETGLKAARPISISVSGEARGLYQELIDEAAEKMDESESTEDAKKSGKKGRKVSGTVERHKLARAFLFKPGDSGQRFRLSNGNTIGNVSFGALEIRPAEAADTNDVQFISATNAVVQAEGAWKLEDRKGVASFEDENNDKGSSTITVPISVPREGRYELTVCWRQNTDNATNVLVEVFSHDDSSLAQPALPPVPPASEAHFFIDETVDSLAFADLEASFQFGPDDYVEINNKGTKRRVTADAVKFVANAGKTAFLVDNDEADGRDDWKELKGLSFEAYNKVGKNAYSDDNERKGELALRYRPAVKTNDWKPDAFYQVLVGYAAKADHETRAPVVVKASRSSPIIQLACTPHARAEVLLEIDASAQFYGAREQTQISVGTDRRAGGEASAAGRGGREVRCAAPGRAASRLGIALPRADAASRLCLHPSTLRRAREEQAGEEAAAVGEDRARSGWPAADQAGVGTTGRGHFARTDDRHVFAKPTVQGLLFPPRAPLPRKPRHGATGRAGAPLVPRCVQRPALPGNPDRRLHHRRRQAEAAARGAPRQDRRADDPRLHRGQARPAALQLRGASRGTVPWLRLRSAAGGRGPARRHHGRGDDRPEITLLQLPQAAHAARLSAQPLGRPGPLPRER